MKSMILKDIYNITHNMRSLGLLLVMFVFIMLPQGGAPGYITTSCVLCSMMVITTFSFDNMSKWEKYALVMPVTKQDLVAAKFIVLLIFTAFGAVSGLVLGIIGGLILGSFHLQILRNGSPLLPWPAQAYAREFFSEASSFPCFSGSARKRPESFL